jgi:urease accessory protein
MRHTGLRMFVAASALVAAAPVLAHTGVGDTNGFAHGFAHPLRGIDHVLAHQAFCNSNQCSHRPRPSFS